MEKHICTFLPCIFSKTNKLCYFLIFTLCKSLWGLVHIKQTLLVWFIWRSVNGGIRKLVHTKQTLVCLDWKMNARRTSKWTKNMTWCHKMRCYVIDATNSIITPQNKSVLKNQNEHRTNVKQWRSTIIWWENHNLNMLENDGQRCSGVQRLVERELFQICNCKYFGITFAFFFRDTFCIV